jgi:hypothetical protein
MNDDTPKGSHGNFAKIIIVLAGIILGQVILYGPSLIGQKILLPLDLLTFPGTYSPPNAAAVQAPPHDVTLVDDVLLYEPLRQFAVSEVHQGRFPLWAPYNFGGIPFLSPKFSLFVFLGYCIKSPVILAWVQLLAAVVGGFGMYCFCRRVLCVGFWPATACAWCYPLTAFFVLWQGSPLEFAIYWLPWLFLAVDRSVCRSGTPPVIGLSVVTALVLTSGALDVAAQALLGSLAFAIWRLGRLDPRNRFGEKLSGATMKLVLGWGLGIMLAAPHVLPSLEYAHTGSRLEHRVAGAEERPPVGWIALPQLVLPDMYGTDEQGSFFIRSGRESNLIESPSAAYAGVLAALLAAPLAWCDRRRWAMNAFWLFLAFLGVSWCLNVPGLVQLMRLPGLNMMSYNRLVFVTSFAILCLTAVGLENLLTGAVQRRWWFSLPAALLAGLCGWCFYRSIVLPEPIATHLERALLHGEIFLLRGEAFPWRLHDVKGIHEIQGWFITHYTVAAIFCGLGFVGWLLVWFQKAGAFRLFSCLVTFLLADLLWFGYGRSAQCDPAQYYPKIPALDAISRSVPGRFIGVNCLPPAVAAGAGLDDIRGYDSVDPSRMVALLSSVAEPGDEPSFAATEFLVPTNDISPPDRIRLPPILDMLNVRYVVYRGAPSPEMHPAFESPDYWVLINSNALPRAFVPNSLENVSDARAELAKLSAPQFNPRDVAYVESGITLPDSPRGTAHITRETATHVTIGVHMETPGLVVLADRWDAGWHACYNGKPAPILRTDYAIRGVVVPAGDGVVEYSYRPASLMLGLGLAGLAATILLACFVISLGKNRLELRRQRQH